MTILKILCYPDPRLRTKAQPVTEFDEALQTLISDMFETMSEHNGVGLAATQVNVHKRLFVMNVSETGSEPKVLINPELLEVNDIKAGMEGCLSFPNVFDSIKRGAHVKVRFQDQNGEFHEMEARDLEAVCIQHERDHLDGKMLIDYLSPLKRMRVEKKMKKLKNIML